MQQCEGSVINGERSASQAEDPDPHRPQRGGPRRSTVSGVEERSPLCIFDEDSFEFASGGKEHR